MKAFQKLIESPDKTNTAMGFVKRFEDSSINGEIDQNYTKILELLEFVNQKIQKILKENENEFFIAYKDQMQKIQTELKFLKKKIDDETLKQKRDEKLKVLMQDRDYFRKEAIKLDNICKDHEKKLKETKFLNKVMNEDKAYYEAFILEIKKENKLLKAELLLNSKNIQKDKPKTVEGQHNESEKHKNSFENNNDTVFPSIMSKDKGTEVQFVTQPTNIFFEEKKKKNKNINNSSSKNHDIINELNDQIKKLTTENQNFKESIEKYKGFIHGLEQKLENEQKNIKKIRVEVSSKIMERTELEQTLLECINEVKKIVKKRKKELIIKKTITSEEIDFTHFKSSDKIKLVQDLMSNEKILDKLYEVVFARQKKDQNNDLDQSTAKLTEYWKMEAEQMESKFHRFNLFKKTLMHNSLSESTNKNFDFSKSLNNFSSRALSLKQKILEKVENE